MYIKRRLKTKKTIPKPIPKPIPKTLYKAKMSWKTTVCSFISAFGEALKHSGHPKLELVGNILMPIGLFCTGYFAKDKSIED